MQWSLRYIHVHGGQKAHRKRTVGAQERVGHHENSCDAHRSLDVEREQAAVVPAATTCRVRQAELALDGKAVRDVDTGDLQIAPSPAQNRLLDGAVH